MNKFLRKHWPLVAMAFLLAAMTVYLFQARMQPVEQKAAQDKESEEGIRLKDIHYVQDDPAHKVKWELDASEAKLSKDQQFVTFANFHVTLKPENKPVVTVQGKQGEFDKRTGLLVLQGDLAGETEDGYRFTTEQAVYITRRAIWKQTRPLRFQAPFSLLKARDSFSISARRSCRSSRTPPP